MTPNTIARTDPGLAVPDEGPVRNAARPAADRVPSRWRSEPPGREVGVVVTAGTARLPIANYDALSPEEIEAVLATAPLTCDDLRRLRAYEANHQDRQATLEAISRRLRAAL